MLHFKEWLAEATYQGREVPLNKPMAGDVKKSKIFIDPNDNKSHYIDFGSLL